MPGRQSRLTGAGAEYELQTFRSHTSFADLFEGAVRLHCVTYCDSPALLLELFDEYDLEELEVVVGDVEDYRESLVGQRAVADRLERLKEAGSLRVYTCPTKTVHSKLYEIEDADGSITLLCGSPNLTRTGWGRQTNCAVVFYTEPDSDVHREFRAVYEDHRDSYGKIFLQDLTEELEATEEDREEVVERWVEGRVSTRDEAEEFHGELSDKIVDVAPDPDDAEARIEVAPPDADLDSLPRGEFEDPDTPSGRSPDAPARGDEAGTGGDDEPAVGGPPESEIVQSTKNFSDEFKARVTDQFETHGQVSGDQVRITPTAYARQTQTTYGVPVLRVRPDDRTVYLSTQNGHGYFGEPPPDDRTALDRTLDHLEAYFETVEKHADSRNTTAFQTHVFEALLYFLWAPFVNRHARMYRASGVRNLDKRLPFLYVHGDSDSGKGTFARFALHLLSGGQVTTPMDADEFGTRMIRSVRMLKTSFPLVIDDVQKQTINRTDPLRNFWSGWSGENRYPALIFISNDVKPDKWFRNRAKVIHFDGRFTSGIEGEVEVNRIIDEGSPLFHWFTHLYLDRDVQLTDDVLYDARAAFAELYDRADRDLPEYFPEEPAEDLYDVGRRTWQRAFDDGKFEMRADGEVLRLEFAGDVEGWEIARLQHDLPNVGADKLGNEVVVEDGDRFRAWLEAEDPGGEPDRGGLVARLRSMLSD